MKNIIWKFASNKIDLPNDYAENFKEFVEREAHIELINKQLERIDLDGKIKDLEDEIKLIPQ